MANPPLYYYSRRVVHEILESICLFSASGLGRIEDSPPSPAPPFREILVQIIEDTRNKRVRMLKEADDFDDLKKHLLQFWDDFEKKSLS